MKPTYPKMGEFQCEGCGRIFATKNELIEHEFSCDGVGSAEEGTANPSHQEEAEGQEADEEALNEIEDQSGVENADQEYEQEDFERAFKGRQERPYHRQGKSKNRNEEKD